jgi:hypothetical protein
MNKRIRKGASGEKRLVTRAALGLAADWLAEKWRVTNGIRLECG